MVKGDSTYRFITDHLGSVRLVVNVETGTIAQRIDYDEFGNVLLNRSGSGDPPLAGTNPDFQPFAYAGGLYDSQTKLVHFGARDYDAVVGRWTAKDPIKFDTGTNVYKYCNNNPINYVDPKGLFCLPYPSKKSKWVFEKKYYDRAFTVHPFFDSIRGSIGHCVWQETAKQDKLRQVTKRKICFEFNKCSKKLISYIKENEPRWERKTSVRVIETRTSSAIRMFSGGDVEQGDWGSCNNPWTGQTIFFKIGN